MPTPTRCAFELPPIPTPAIPFPFDPATFLALLALLKAARDPIANLPLTPFCPLD